MKIKETIEFDKEEAFTTENNYYSIKSTIDGKITIKFHKLENNC